MRAHRPGNKNLLVQNWRKNRANLENAAIFSHCFEEKTMDNINNWTQTLARSRVIIKPIFSNGQILNGSLKNWCAWKERTHPMSQYGIFDPLLPSTTTSGEVSHEIVTGCWISIAWLLVLGTHLTKTGKQKGIIAKWGWTRIRLKAGPNLCSLHPDNKMPSLRRPSASLFEPIKIQQITGQPIYTRMFSWLYP